MKNKIIFIILVVFSFGVFMTPNRVNAVCDLSAIRNEYSSRGLSGSGMEQGAIDNCLATQRRLDQQTRDQADADGQSAQALYQIKLTFFYKLDAIEKQLEAPNSSNLNYAQYRVRSADCYQSMRIPSDPTTLDPSVFLSLIGNKEKCVDYLLKYVTPKSNDQICSESFGSKWEWDGLKNSKGNLTCKCKDGYVQSSDGESCLIKSTQTQQKGTLCNGKYWNACSAGKSFVCPSIGDAYCEIPKTKDQICQGSFGSGSKWDGAKNNTDSLICDCQTGYVWNEQQTKCILIPKTDTVTIIPITKKVPQIENTQKKTIEKATTSAKNELAFSTSSSEKVATSTEVLKQKGFWARFMGWFGF